MHFYFIFPLLVVFKIVFKICNREMFKDNHADHFFTFESSGTNFHDDGTRRLPKVMGMDTELLDFKDFLSRILSIIF